MNKIKHKLVIAGNYGQYQQWLGNHVHAIIEEWVNKQGASPARLTEEMVEHRYCHYISSTEKLYGHRGEDSEVILTGEYWLNPAYNDVRFHDYIKSRNIKVILQDKGEK